MEGAEEAALDHLGWQSKSDLMYWSKANDIQRFEVLTKAFAAAEARGMERAAKICEQQQQDFLSPEYATGQPLSSFQERFACGQCAEAIRKETPNDR